jgi:hypothetical protein
MDSLEWQRDRPTRTQGKGLAANVISTALMLMPPLIVVAGVSMGYEIGHHALGAAVACPGGMLNGEAPEARRAYGRAAWRLDGGTGGHPLLPRRLQCAGLPDRPGYDRG